MFHVSDADPLRRLEPRPAPRGSELEGRHLVWAIDEQRLPHYLLPRECPRGCWLVPKHRRVVAVETSWLPKLRGAHLIVHELDPAPFLPIPDSMGPAEPSGYWVSETAADVVAVERVADCVAAIEERGAELRAVPDLWPLVDAVTSSDLAYSCIRMRNARPRG